MLRVRLDFHPLALDLGLMHIPLALRRKECRATHRKSRANHAGKTGDEDKFWRCTCRTGNCGDDAKDSAKPIVDAVNRIPNPARRSVGMPLFAGEEGVEA